MDPWTPYRSPEGKKVVTAKTKIRGIIPRRTQLPLKKYCCMIGQVITEEYLKVINYIKSTPPVNIRSEIKNLASCDAADGSICQDKCTNNWDLDKI